MEKIFCTNEGCKKYIDPKSDWKCPWCGTLNGYDLGAFPPFFHGRNLNEPCKKCGKLAANAICPHCNREFLINSWGDKQKAITISLGFLHALGKLAEGFKQEESEGGQEKQFGYKEVAEELVDVRDTLRILFGKATPEQIEKDRLKQELEKEKIMAEIRKTQGVGTKKEEKKESVFAIYEKTLEDEEAKMLFQRKMQKLRLKKKLDQINDLEEMKHEEIEKKIIKYCVKYKVKTLGELPMEAMLKLKDETEDIGDMFDKMISEVRREASV